MRYSNTCTRQSATYKATVTRDDATKKLVSNDERQIVAELLGSQKQWARWTLVRVGAV
jgi:hypothetical protein